ncbi:nitric-oxide reductase large subunit [Labilibaculum euxinus]|uniref:Nitric-oxide reductase large subunit n=1 Tax=Labilibaculum euxinus TaxID=2686357 RepID=A0A7M4DBI7_9BACT|nr:nitric-oxide reductase large subunit [Labilibaculum euxinus]MUP40016.1 nitric-oxide reductase large subunit [Labilibaculum euxinus]MVB09221.1 nitric-oxide reductase large subunit [Labilibaculum euxinus]
MKTKRLWYGFIAVIVLSFAVLLYFGREIYREKPPIPDQIITTSGEVIVSGQDIKDGQNVWQSIGGQEIGSIWGHGAYQAPDWTADWLHREAVFLLDYWGNAEFDHDYKDLNNEQKGMLEARLQKEMRTNTYDVGSRNLVISDLRAKAFKAIGDHFTGVFMDGEAQAHLREAYAIPVNTVKDQERMDKMNAFFFWATWATVTNRPEQEITYTNNWPAEELVGNRPTSSLLLWTGFSVIILLAGIGWMGWFYASNRGKEEHNDMPLENPVMGSKMFPSMKATLKYFWVVTLLMLVQITAGVITAHYGVEGSAFYGIPLDQWLPYSVTRTWHVQIGIFWIATSWLATGLFFAPAIAGKEPKYQKLGVNVLFLSLLVIVVGSLVGQWMGIMQKLGYAENFWFGHQGYEYVDLGRFWQIFLFAGLFIWLGLMARALLPALRARTENRNLLIMFLIASLAIASFYGAGLMWGQQTHLAIAEYWRWWVVHLWVEGFFEVFATVIIAFLFVRMKLLGAQIATTTVIFSTIIFLSGGILGTFHHLYFSGTPVAVLALGASFSALEVVPLVFMGFEAYHNINLTKSGKWIEDYKWPIYCFVAVAFWNFLGAGIFGFLINPPVALYYMQGLNTTAVHGHTALFGVYGFLGIGLMLFVLRDMDLTVKWKDGPIKFAFWSINIGLLLMVLISVLPIGLAQTWASVKVGFWYARSAEFMQQDYISTLKWMRVFGDTIFAAGMFVLAYHIFGLKFGWTTEKK